jgi:hypothetical protein
MLQITEIIESPLENKKYRAYTNDGKHYDFGQKGSKTYLDHHNQFLRERYRERHLANEKEYYLIDNEIMSPALLIYYISWGDNKKLEDNMQQLNNRLKLKK